LYGDIIHKSTANILFSLVTSVTMTPEKIPAAESQALPRNRCPLTTWSNIEENSWTERRLQNNSMSQRL
jgi:hypothetical protein